jgi:hydroxypyruvate isomerase
MPKLAANVSMLFPQLDFLDRFAAARAAGFRAVEYQFPYDHDAKEVARRVRDARLEAVLHNLPLGGNPKVERGIACLPGREREFRDNVERGIEYAVAAGCPRLNCISGIAPADKEHLDVLIGNLRYAARKLGAAGLQLMVEPVSTRTVPGFILNRSLPAIDVLNAVGEGTAFLQYDLYHMQIMEGDLAMTMERLLPRIGHMQIADVPARNEPGTGELNFDFLLRHIDSLGYSGWIGCEYNPRGDTVEGLKWARAYLS